MNRPPTTTVCPVPNDAARVARPTVMATWKVSGDLQAHAQCTVMMEREWLRVEGQDQIGR